MNQFSFDQPLQLYLEQFEIPYIKATKEFYEQEAATLMSQCTIAEYMAKVGEALIDT